MIRKVLDAKAPSLRQKSKPVVAVDKKVKSLIADLKDTLASQNDPEGVGLAAPQIGKNVRVFVINHKGLERVIMNPKVVSISSKKASITDKNKNQILEGCLSVPHIYGPLRRAKSVTIEYLAETGEIKTETFENFGAQIVLHEIDHLEGILFIDKIIASGGHLFKHNPDDSWEDVEL